MSLMRTGEVPGSAREQHPRPRHTLFIDRFVDAQSPLSPVWGPRSAAARRRTRPYFSLTFPAFASP